LASASASAGAGLRALPGHGALTLTSGALALAVRALAWELALLALLAGELAASAAGTALVLLGVEAIPRVAYRRTA
jgi:hypothetical protein